MIAQFSFKKCALAWALSTAVLQSAFAAPAFYTFSIDDSNATTGTWTRPGSSGNFNYASVYFMPTLDVTGIKFGQSEAGVDTWMFVYEGTFDPNSPGGSLANNDDMDISDHQAILGNAAIISCSGSDGLCPQVTLDVSAGKVYSIVISTFSPGAPLTSGGVLNMTFYTTGDGIFYSAPPVVPAVNGGVFDSASQLRNSPALNAARVIDATPELLALFSGLNAQQRSDAATQTLPLVLGATTSAISNSLSMINNVIQARQGSTSGLSSGDATLAGEHFWIKSFGSWASQNARSGVSGFDANSKGLALGLDAAVSQDTRLGLAFAYAKTDVDSDGTASQSAQIDTYQLIGYGTHTLTANTRLNFQVDVGQNRTEGRRQILFSGDTAKADYDGYSAHVGLGIDHDLRLSEQLTFIPSARVDYTWIGEEAYREAGAGLLNLQVDKRDTEALVFSLDGRLDYQVTESTILSVNLGGGYDAINESASMTSTYAGASGAAFRTDGLELEPWLASAGIGLSHTLDNGTEVSLRYDAEARSGFNNQGAQLKARWAF